MKKLPAWLVYTVLRLLLIVVPLAIFLLLFGKEYWPVWVIASVAIGFTLSYIFLARFRHAMAEELVAARSRAKVAKGDDADEDAEIEASEVESPEVDSREVESPEVEASDRPDEDKA